MFVQETCKHLTPASVHFTLRSPVVEMDGAVNELRRVASTIGFAGIGPKIVLAGEDCAVEDKDPLAGLKVHARGFLIVPGGGFSILPCEINGFTIELPNGLPFHIGLCRYPETFEIDKHFLNTKISGAQWMSFFRSVRHQQDKPGICIESHIKALTLLRKAEQMGILASVSDPYKQWSNPNSSVFDRICDQQKEMAFVH